MLNISSNIGYRCPKCGYTWSTYTTVYAGYVYCGNRKSYAGGISCNHKFKAEQIKYTSYSIWELCSKETAKDDMEKILTEALKKLKESKCTQ